MSAKSSYTDSFQLVTKAFLSDLETLFPSSPTTSITVVTVTQRSSRREQTAEQDRDQLLHKVSPVIFYFSFKSL